MFSKERRFAFTVSGIEEAFSYNSEFGYYRNKVKKHFKRNEERYRRFMVMCAFIFLVALMIATTDYTGARAGMGAVIDSYNAFKSLLLPSIGV
jgi:hypothetical protein